MLKPKTHPQSALQKVFSGPPAGMDRLEIVGRHTLKDEVYARIRDALMSGEFAPGERLTVRRMADLTRTSVTPVREAFRRLTSEGALEPMTSGATRVPTIDAAEFEEITAVRLTLEGMASRLAAERISVEELEIVQLAHSRVLASIEKEDSHAEARANEAFHFAVYRAAKSNTLLRMIQGLWLRIGPVLISLYTQLNAAQPRRPSIKFHAQLIDALRAGDAAAAERALREDVGSAAALYVAQLRKKRPKAVRPR